MMDCLCDSVVKSGSGTFCTIWIQILNYLSGSDLFLYLHNLCYFIPKLCQILPGLHTYDHICKEKLLAAHL
jgi:hypothetical protein